MISNVQLAHAPDSTDHALGAADSKLALVEYGDYECPFSAQALSIVDRLRELFGPNLRYIFRNFPLTETHPLAFLAAQAAEAAAMQTRFWEMHRLLFRNQPLLRSDSIFGYARSLCLDLDTFAHDLQSRKVNDRILRDLQGGVQSSLHGTPTFYINGLRFDGPVSEHALLSDLEAALEAASRSA